MIATSKEQSAHWELNRTLRPESQTAYVKAMQALQGKIKGQEEELSRREGEWRAEKAALEEDWKERFARLKEDYEA